MAKTDNLTDFLTDVANAIREKKGTTGTINPQDFSSEIASIESGGGAVVSASISDVNFLDYDGTILHSYTKEQFLALSAMPELPTREGLICQGWNYRWGEAVSYVTDYGKLNVGAMYITDDGDTRLYIRIATEGRMTVPLYWSQTVANGVIIDWGDGSDVQSVSGTGNKNTTHTYAKHGDYVIRLKVASGCTLGLGSGSPNCVMGSTNNNGKVYCNMLQKIEIGSGITSINNYAFYYCTSLKSVSIPTNVFHMGNYIFAFCHSLVHITISTGVLILGNYAFNSCSSLRSVGFPLNFEHQNGFSTSLGTNAFYGCNSLAFTTLSASVTDIPSSTFYNCYSLASVSIPSSVTRIGTHAFYNCYGMVIYDFTKHTSVPTLESTNAFSGIPSDCVIKVPSSLVEEWKSATNWSTYANQIVGV